MNAKWVIFGVSNLGALLWGFFGATGNLPLEDDLGLPSEISILVYLVVAGAGLMSFLLSVIWLVNSGGPGVEIFPYLVADVGAILWGYWALNGAFPLEDLLGVSSSLAGGVYLVVGIAGVISAFLLLMTVADNGGSASVPS